MIWCIFFPLSLKCYAMKFEDMVRLLCKVQFHIELAQLPDFEIPIQKDFEFWKNQLLIWSLYYAPPSRLEGLSCYPCRGNTRGAFVFPPTFKYYLYTVNIVQILSQGMVDGFASKPALRQDTTHVFHPVHCRWWLSGRKLTLKIWLDNFQL